MKAIITIFCFALFLFSCKKETTDDVSQVFKVPTITVKNGEVTQVPVGANYSDAGAEYTGEEGTTITIQAANNTVNTAVPGLYLITYQQTSTSGIYETEAVRYVAVTNVNNPVDYSGTYLRPATGESVIVSKVANGVYRVQNPGGAASGRGIVVYFVETAPNVFVAPAQPSADGPFAVLDITFTSTGATWRVENATYGTALRTFEKQ
jgi:hypothetical protein